MDWRDSDLSEEEAHTHSRKRSSRACDQCRKTKSKCERSVSDNIPCKSCAATGTTCTFLGPSYKRGPPKGYIHAIEQRWHQVESLLGAILQCPDPRVQRLVSELRQDDLARDIINRVDMGPYGPSGRRSQPPGATKEDFFASILKSAESSSGRDPSRSRRQSRVSREIVSSTQDHGLSVVPTKEWQDNLSARLAASGVQASGYGLIVNPIDANDMSLEERLDGEDGLNGEGPTQPDWNGMYTLEQAGDELSQEATEGIRRLSIDEHREVRYHGKSSGLHLLSRSLRTDDHNEGIWRLPMARVWPPANYTLIPEEDSEAMLPPPHVQDQLLSLYFTYTHPVFPIIHKTRFLAEYNARKQEKLPYNTSSSKLEPSQEVTPLLLLAMFSICSRFSDEELSRAGLNDGRQKPSSGYLQSALAILTQNFHRSRPSTVQALLLLGYREFGTGSMEQGWIFIGMAIRMAFDLGMNCDSTDWRINGKDLFTREELQTRRQIWWSCYLVDRYASVYMGRPLMIKDVDYDAPMPECGLEEESRLWQPIPSPFIDISYSPTPGRVLSCFCAATSLAIIVGEIITNVYPVRMSPTVSKRVILADLEIRLDRWYIGLQENLTYDVASRRAVPPPHVLFLHIRYWGAVLLLNRAFIPNWKGTGPSPVSSTMELKAFDLAQGAASHVSAIVTTYRDRFSLKRSSPFLPAYILSAAIMHILTLTLRSSNVQASLGLEQCMSALEELKGTWTSAARAWDLLNGFQRGNESIHLTHAQGSGGHKRPADDAFGMEKSSDYLQHEAFRCSPFGAAPKGENGVQELGTRIMAHMLGLDIPGVEPSTSYFPGYEWWPRPNEAVQQQPLSPMQGSGRLDVNSRDSRSNANASQYGLVTRCNRQQHRIDNEFHL
ncbi:fungal-specific transcription factor domain-containing protein [Amanita rubescens]|nr:fungal-specific transcription factor domain-containing protein [Amanita rubescens]